MGSKITKDITLTVDGKEHALLTRDNVNYVPSEPFVVKGDVTINYKFRKTRKFACFSSVMNCPWSNSIKVNDPGQLVCVICFGNSTAQEATMILIEDPNTQQLVLKSYTLSSLLINFNIN